MALLELDVLLRNPAVVARPLGAAEAAEACQPFRSDPRWALIENATVMPRVWEIAAEPSRASPTLSMKRLYGERLVRELGIENDR